jgi:hypothetical protein
LERWRKTTTCFINKLHGFVKVASKHQTGNLSGNISPLATGCCLWRFLRLFSPELRLDLLFLFSYIGGHAYSAIPQMLRRLLQEVRPRRIEWYGRFPRQLDLRGVLDVRREAKVLTL